MSATRFHRHGNHRGVLTRVVPFPAPPRRQTTSDERRAWALEARRRAPLPEIFSDRIERMLRGGGGLGGRIEDVVDARDVLIRVPIRTTAPNQILTYEEFTRRDDDHPQAVVAARRLTLYVSYDAADFGLEAFHEPTGANDGRCVSDAITVTLYRDPVKPSRILGTVGTYGRRIK